MMIFLSNKKNQKIIIKKNRLLINSKVINKYLSFVLRNMIDNIFFMSSHNHLMHI